MRMCISLTRKYIIYTSLTPLMKQYSMKKLELLSYSALFENRGRVLMMEEELSLFLNNVTLPFGELLSDGKTFRISEELTAKITRKPKNAFIWPSKMLILSDGHNKAVGGLVFFGNMDIMALMLPQYVGCGYMSEVCKNGIIKSELYEDQHVGIDTGCLNSFDDFKMKIHLLNDIGIVPKNLVKLYEYMHLFFPECANYTLEGFLQEFG